MEAHMLCLVLLACILLVSATPTGPRRQDLQHSMFINNIRGLKRITDTLPSVKNKLGAFSVAKASDFPDMLDSDLTDLTEEDESIPKGFLGKLSAAINKRQGAWSYDYGLGGGRFGKRNYGDYGIGGGRFGRDVDHVDLSDANDADLAS